MKRHLRNISLVFLLLSAHLAAKATVYYVTYDGKAVSGGWQTITLLADAIKKAVANDEIWIQGSQNAQDAYKVPTAGYTIKSGVKIYGGFKGTETRIDQREYIGGKRYKLKYRTMLTGDIGSNDKINDTNFIFPIGEATNGRTENADNVLILDMTPTPESGNNNGYPTVVNGLTIARGHNKDTTGKGAGIYVTGSNTGGGAFRIEQCFFLANYAPKGGAIYIEADVKHIADYNMIDRCAFFNNAAGTRNMPSNEGAAIYAQGQVKIVNSVIYNNANGGINAIQPDGSSTPAAGDVQVINSTITRNSASGIEGKNIQVYNTVVWGNTTISSTHRPNTISHCAFIGAEESTSDKNVKLAEKNLDANGPAFATPSLKIGYDADFSSFEELYPAWNWESQGETKLVDKGDDQAYEATPFGSEDLVGDPRIKGNAIDIGAYEYQPVAATHIRYVKQGGTGDGTSWATASGNLQRMIDDLAETGGEVWVAAGTYEPVAYLVSDKVYTASFRMRDNVSVYGGFDNDNPESLKNERAKGTMPWDFTNKTILQGQGYKSSSWGEVNSASRHVVWFAPLAQDGEAEVPFTAMTHLDGVTIEGGYASGGNGAADFLTDRGAGIYMKGSNVSVTNCIVRNNYATGAGGGIYMDGGGRVERTLVFNNVSNDNGGAVYMDGAGIVRRCMMSNNQGRKGAGAYLKKAEAGEPDDLQLSTCVVSNNTSTHNGAVYCDNGGVVVHNTIVNNLCTKSTDTADGDAAQTAGLYIDGYALLVNSVLWNNRFGRVDGTDIPVYIKNPSVKNVSFRYNAISGAANAVWNSTYQEETLFLTDGNGGDGNMPGPDFDTTKDNLHEEVGVQTDWDEITYFWPTAAGSALWSAGLEQGRFPSEVQVAAELDIAGNLFAGKPSIGASYTKELVPKPSKEETDKLILYVSSESMSKDGDGSSWEQPFRSINKAIAYFAELDATTVSGKTLEIRVLEGDLWPRFSYVNEDAQSATINLLKTPTGSTLRIEGGWYYNTKDKIYERDPLTHRSIIEGNREGRLITEGVYHVLTAEAGANVELDGFHIVNGYASGKATIQHGAGLLAYDGADVTLVNCIFEDNTAVSGAAVYAEGSARVTMRNCVVNNNTNTDAAEAVVYCANTGNLTLEHVSFINNIGAAPALTSYPTCFALNNSSGNSGFNSQINTIGVAGAKNFANPANDKGAKLGYDTYLGGYAVYRPLTSSDVVATHIINKALSGTSSGNRQDITVLNDRNLGGVPDLGAYEAELPVAGTVLYVRTESDGGDDMNDGLSWGKAFATLEKALEVAENDKNMVVKEIWVSKGTYTHKSDEKIHDQYYAYKFIEGVNVYGGFCNVGTPNRDDRNPKMYETILQPGNINPEEKAQKGEGSYGRVLVQEKNFGTETVYDGFTLRNGYLFSAYRQNISGNIFTVYTDQIGKTGGAGVYLLQNGVLENCEITGNLIAVYPYHSNLGETGPGGGGYHQAGAGIYNAGGTIRNCRITNNKHWHYLVSNGASSTESAWMYGSGLYMTDGSVYNTVISKNISQVFKNNVTQPGFHQVAVGSVFLVNGNFYNNTVVGNEAHLTAAEQVKIAISGIFVYNGIKMYNCIVSGNNDNINVQLGDSYLGGYARLYDYPVAAFTAQDAKSYKIAPDIVDVKYSCINIDENNEKNLCDTNDKANTNKYGDPLLDNDYRLTVNSPAINKGTDDLGKDVSLPSYDADYTDRIKDCTVDIGAYERSNQDNVAPDGKAIYYVTQNGAGTANGDSPANAACAMKLQEVLNAAGEYAATNSDKNVIVKVAGYEGGSFTYHVNKLADEKKPQSYSYVIPYGVTVMGGYNENAPDWNDKDYGANTYRDSDGKEQKKRDITKYKTVFSAIKQATATTQEVQGYHTVTFKEKTADWTGADKQTIIDGVYIQDGSATSLAGGDNNDIKGGAAIVPAWAHVRNCVIQGNKAKQGGGLYVLPGGWVSGCVIKMNDADGKGGGIYAESDGSQHAYFISNTIADNTAAQGGGVYIEPGAAMTLNSVIWNNSANSDKNVSAAVNEREKDAMLDAMISELPDQDWYPFNNCYVESIELPYNLQNTKMESSLSTYFANEDYALKYYSPLIDHGMLKQMQDYLTKPDYRKNVSTHDMQGLPRVSGTDKRMDVGAFAFEGTMLDDTKLLKRIFVSHNSEYVLAESEADRELMGKTFYTPFTWLGDALEYIRTVRASSDVKLAELAKKTTFEIYVAAGTYTPKYQRPDDTGTQIPVIDLRQNSFIVPYGVKIYGGFTGEEKYSSNVEGETIDKITFESGEISFTSLTDDNVNALLTSRDGSDFNDNQVKDAWEMAEQTILSGNINLSNEEQNVYHVIYSAKDADYTGEQKVLLDGVTIQDGRTLKEVGDVQDAPKGRGGGIYSNGVHYTVVNSRLLNNKAVRGGAAFVQNADLTLVNSMVAGNEAWKEGNIATGKNASGGGVFVISTTDGADASLKAVNTLWANNESVEAGGAIGAEGAGASIDLMNNTFVKNKAKNDAVLYHTAATKDNVKVVNTMMWGNESEDDKVKDVTVTYSASDRDYDQAAGNSLFGLENEYHNILLSPDNLALDGPRFAEPSTETGLDGYNLNSKWNPIAVSPLTDHGSGMKNSAGNAYEGSDQAYRDWFETNAPEYADKYMLSPDYLRYSGPNNEDGTPGNKPIDIGVYEYQYVLEFSKMDKIYVATESSGKGTGESWQNATDDLRGALIGAANPESGGDTRNVYIKGGDYPWPSGTSGNSVFPVHTGGKITWTNLNITGSCTGAGDEQDFSKPTVINRHPFVTASNYLMEISSSHSAPKSVTVSGLTFSNSNVGNNINDDCSGVKVAANNGTLTMKHVAFRNNPKDGLDISSNSGTVLLVNALFADNGVTGLNVSDNPDNTTLVNTTFANNGTDMTNGLTKVYNSTSWNNGTQNMPATEGKNNRVFAANTVNNDIEQGPNFYDPENADKDLRDYRIRPSLTLLNTGSNVLYAQHALGNTSADLTEESAGEYLKDEKDLYNISRKVDSKIDIGAYEYRAPMQQIIYVKEGIVKDNDGESWETALTDLQNAANLAGIYVNQHPGESAYVFVHNNVNQGLNVQLGNVKIYGGMNDEVTQPGTTANIVNDLLNQRAGLLERTNRSQIKDALTISGANSVVDGFEVNVSPVINNGMLATSVVNTNVAGKEGNSGILYNSLVKGNVSGIKTVNVTATGTIAPVEGNGNNRDSATGDNKYLTEDDGWNYQLNETAIDDIDDIDKGNLQDISTYINMVGHNRDIAGNKRIRNTVDNGCFETWNITKAMQVADDTKTDKDCIVREGDYPHGKSVVYVRHDADTNDGAELLITKDYTDAAPFNPGFLLLEHHAGLRGNGKAVGLTHFAIERNIGNLGKDMAVMPFEVTSTEGTATLSLYDAATRAGYSYQYSDTDGAWATTNYAASRTPITTGWLLEGTENSKVRFYGNSYVENVGEGKNIELVKNNFNEPWTSSSSGGNKFTHKENMSWNLFGSPYLCAMNYSDMQYGRVMYGYQNGKYITLNTINDNDEGYIPAGDAVFTQTATLKSSETFTVDKPIADKTKSGLAYQGSKDMTVALSRAYTRAEEGGAEDRLQLKAVPAEESRNDFDINGDGVKWMSANIPQIYAVMNGGRYSLLSAVNVEGEVSVGVTLPEAGMYTFSVPEDCDVEAYETVVLKDNVTGKLIDLLEGQYDFSADEAGEIAGRFTVSFNRMVDDKMGNDLRVWCPSRNKVCLQGTESGDVITIYSASGVVIANRIASSSMETISATIQGVAIVEVQRNGQTIVRKVRD